MQRVRCTRTMFTAAVLSLLSAGTAMASSPSLSLIMPRVGVTWVSLGVPGRSRGEYLDGIARFGAEVIA